MNDSQACIHLDKCPRVGNLRPFPPPPCQSVCRLSFPAWMFGDPHITTLDNASYTFNGLGDFLLVRAGDGNSSFLLQGRTAQTGSAQATNFIAFAAQYNSSSLDPILVSEAGALDIPAPLTESSQGPSARTLRRILVPPLEENEKKEGEGKEGGRMPGLRVNPRDTRLESKLQQLRWKR